MAHSLLEPTAEFRARVLAGRSLADRDDFEGAERSFRGLLGEARGRHAGNHALALRSLMTLYGRGGQYFEAHLLARRLAALALEAGGHNDTMAFALAGECGALAKLELLEPLAAALPAFRGVLDRAAQPLHGLELAYHSAAGTLAMQRGDISRARHHVASYRRTLEEAPALEAIYSWSLTMAEAHLAFQDGHPAIALRILDRVRSRQLTPPFRRLGELQLVIASHIAVGWLEAARKPTEEAIAIVEAVGDRSYSASDCIHEGQRIAREVERLEAWDLVQRLEAGVAAAVLVRLREVDRCMRDLPELGLDNAQSSAVLAGYRRQFLQEQKALLARVAALLSAHEGGAVRTLLAHPLAPDHVAVCAWCESVCPGEGRWLPIGHFIPREGSLRVTHGICPTCATRPSLQPA